MKKVHMLLAFLLILFFAGCGSGGGSGSDPVPPPSSSEKAITAFSLNGVSGIINESGKTIEISVPFGADVTDMVAAFTTTGTSVKVGSIIQESGVTANNYTLPVIYTVTAADATTQNYTVTVTVATSSAKAITAFALNSVVGTINETSKTVTVVMPSGMSVTNLVATFTTTGVSVKVGSIIQESGATANNYTLPVIYTVTAADATTQNYTVTVTVATSSAKAITSFSLNGAMGTINQTSKAIAVVMPYGTSVTNLVATFTTTGVSVKVDGAEQKSGTTAHNFTNPVVYTVTAADASTQDYTVTVTVAAPPSPSSRKEITAFSLNGAVGIINQTSKTIAVYLPCGTDLTALKATFTTTGVSVKVGSLLQISGSTENDFSSPLTYTVTAANDTIQDYIVTVTLAGSISGQVSGNRLSGVTITLSGDGSASTTTDSSGYYSFDQVACDSYTITPSLSGYYFILSKRDIIVSGAMGDQNFTSESNIDYAGTYYGELRFGPHSVDIRMVISGYSEASLSGTFEDLEYGYGLILLSSGYISGNTFYAEGYNADSSTSLVAEGTFSADGLTLSGNGHTGDGINGTFTVTKE